MGEMRMGTCMCDWVTVLYSRKNILLGKFFFFLNVRVLITRKKSFFLFHSVSTGDDGASLHLVDVILGEKSLHSAGHLSESRRKVS